MQGYISDEFFNKYKYGTKPKEPVYQKDSDEPKARSTTLIDKTINDLKNETFITYKERTSGTGFHLVTIKDAFERNNYHEGMHLGYMPRIRNVFLEKLIEISIDPF